MTTFSCFIMATNTVKQVKLIQTKRFVIHLWNAIQHIKMKNLLTIWHTNQKHTIWDSIFKNTTKPKNLLKRKREFSCSFCGVSNDHYRTTCPLKNALEGEAVVHFWGMRLTTIRQA